MKAANTTVIIITHRIGILGATDKLAIMQDGAVSAFGDSKEIFERCLARPQVARANLRAEDCIGSHIETSGDCRGTAEIVPRWRSVSDRCQCPAMPRRKPSHDLFGPNGDGIV